jgi:hypothetical protein
MPSRYSMKRIAAMEPQIIADLRRLFRQPYSREAFAAALPPPELDAPTRYHKALCLPLVRCQVQMRWESLWASCPDYAERRRDLRREEWEQNIERTAQSLAQWLCYQYLPSAQEEVKQMAVLAKREIMQHLRASDGEASALPPPLPTESGRSSLPFGSFIVRREPIRSWLIAEIERRRENKEKQRKRDPHRDNIEQSRLLKRALAPYLDPMLDSNITRRVLWLGDEPTPYEREAHRLSLAAKELIGARWVSIEQSGQPAEICPALFLKIAHEWALSNRKQPRPCHAVGSSHAAKRARDCAAILEYLGEIHRSSLASSGDGSASLNRIAQAVRGVTGGKTYQRIASLTTKLVEMGFLIRIDEGQPTNGQLAIARELGEAGVWRALYATDWTSKR